MPWEVYEKGGREEMARAAVGVSELCLATGDPHLRRFGRRLSGRLKGFVANAWGVPAEKMQDVRHAIETLGVQGCGRAGDWYLFLKILDATRRKPLSGH